MTDMRPSNTIIITFYFHDSSYGKGTDKTEGQSTCTVNIPAYVLGVMLPMANIHGWGQELSEKMQAISLCALHHYTVSSTATNRDYVLPTDPDIDVERKGRFTFNTEFGHTTSLDLPGFDMSNVLPDGINIDTRLLNPDVYAFVTLMIDPWGPSAVEPCDSRAEDIISLRSAQKIHRGNGVG